MTILAVLEVSWGLLGPLGVPQGVLRGPWGVLGGPWGVFAQNAQNSIHSNILGKTLLWPLWEAIFVS